MYLIGEQEIEAVRRVINSGRMFRYLDETGETYEFEKAWSEKIGVKHTIAVTSGTAALICCLVGLEIGPGDEVIVPAYTFMATALAPLAVGAVPIIAEVDESLTIDPADVERKITPRTRAIIPVHMNGFPSNMDAIMAIARKHNLAVVEDACQADGGSYKGKRLGSIGDAGAFSFNYYKIITCGEGGAVVTSDPDIHDRARIHHDGGCVFFEPTRELRVPFFAGWNFRMNEVLSAILRVQLGRLEDILSALRADKRLLMDELADEEAFTFNPINDRDGDCATTLGLLFDSVVHANDFMARMTEQGVGLGSPINSGRHVYCNWEPILKQCGAHHPGRDAFKLTPVPVSYSPDMCPNSLSALARTVFVSTSPSRSPDDASKLVAAIKRAAAAPVLV